MEEAEGAPSEALGVFALLQRETHLPSASEAEQRQAQEQTGSHSAETNILHAHLLRQIVEASNNVEIWGDLGILSVFIASICTNRLGLHFQLTGSTGRCKLRGKTHFKVSQRQRTDHPENSLSGKNPRLMVMPPWIQGAHRGEFSQAARGRGR